MPTIIQPVRNLPNGTRINGVEHFYQTTKPTTRTNGSPLVVGDIWYNPVTGIVGTWTGSDWVGPYQEITHPQLVNINASSTGFYGTLNTTGSVLVDRVICFTSVASPNNSTNYWTIDVELAPIQQTGTRMASFSTINDVSGQRLGKTENLNLVYDSRFFSSNAGAILRLAWTRTGNPGLFYAGASLRYRNIL